MDKNIIDRLNYLKSELSECKRKKISKIIDFRKVEELEIRIDEIEKLINKWMR